MKMVKILPTNKFGQVYYGPKTVKEAECQIQDGAKPQDVAETLAENGYRGVSQRILKKYC
jgi:hypothetical protein